MKLFRFGRPGRERPGVQLENGQRVDCGAFLEDWNESFFENDGVRRLQEWLGQEGRRAPRLEGPLRLGPAIARPSKIICVGLNYRDHAKETGGKIPDEPVIFFKSTTALSGPDDPVMIPRGGTKVDWEVELGVVIGKTCRYVSESQAMSYVAGFVLHNDYSERVFQLERTGQWVKGKSCDTFAPVGPYLATSDEVSEYQNLNLFLEVNGEVRQRSNTQEMAFGVPYLVSYISQFMTLLAGDLISTGTPAGVGLGMNPPTFLKVGDVVTCRIDKLGAQSQKIIAFEERCA